MNKRTYDEMRELYRGSPFDDGTWEKTQSEIVADMMTPMPRPPWYKRWWTTVRCFVRYNVLGLPW